MRFIPNSSRSNVTALLKLTLTALGLLCLASLTGCNNSNDYASGSSKASQPVPAETVALMERHGTHLQSPMLIRTYKKEAEFEIWKMKDNGEYALLKTYPMCRWSGQLGPKAREGDRQVPEGFYAITPAQMNPHSNYYLSFNVGYPNAIDRALGHTGGEIMVHGDCSSAGCFSMTDKQIAEIYAIAREAFAGGQREIQMQSYPFKMTTENLAKHRYDPNMAFWRQLKEGADHFEVTKQEPKVGACDRHYVFDANPVKPTDRLEASSPCPALTRDESLQAAVAKKQEKDNQEIAELIARGTKPIKLVYDDGGQNPEFAYVDWVSRPDALAHAPREILLDEHGRELRDLSEPASAPQAPGPQKIQTASLQTGVLTSGNGQAVTTNQPAVSPKMVKNNQLVDQSTTNSIASAANNATQSGQAVQPGAQLGAQQGLFPNVTLPSLPVLNFGGAQTAQTQINNNVAITNAPAVDQTTNTPSNSGFNLPNVFNFGQQNTPESTPAPEPVDTPLPPRRIRISARLNNGQPQAALPQAALPQTALPQTAQPQAIVSQEKISNSNHIANSSAVILTNQPFGQLQPLKPVPSQNL